MLPYPSYMPGNKIYKVSRLIDAVNSWWYFGSISKIKYHLGLSDKYLVEAKTLFEYKQYLLGVDALSRSTSNFEKLPYYIESGRKEGKDMSRFRLLIEEALKKHVDILTKMKADSPTVMEWTPEKSISSTLLLHIELEKAIEKVRSTTKKINTH
jgi:hypothetical protein